MGYRVPKRELELTFEGTDYDGAVVRCRLDIPLARVLELQRTDDDVASIYALFGDEFLVSWNLEDDNGDPIPATGAGMLAQPPMFCAAVLQAWQEQVTKAPAPLVQKSPAGSSSAVPLATTAVS